MKAFLAAFILVLVNTTVVYADRSVTAYFLNDSVNGLRVSDAYETHNMGLVYTRGEYYAKLDFGIVSPDMHLYKNRFREANRSFGEIVTFEFGQSTTDQTKLSPYFRIRSSGHYNIDQMQEFLHSIFSMQRVIGSNDLIRMPNATWFGVGMRYNANLENRYLGNTSFILNGYAGSDTITAQAALSKKLHKDNYTLSFELGAKIVGFDEIISAAPIEADARAIIPFASAGIDFNLLGYDIFIRDTFSLPTIQNDDRPFGVLEAGISVSF